MEKIQKPVLQVLTVIFIFALFVSAMRGSFQKRPAIRKWASVSKDAFLNKTVMNPYIQFKYAMQDFKELNNSVNRSNPFLANDESISDVLNSYFSSDSSYQTISQYLEKKNKGSVFHNYDNIFLIVMESLDSWPFKKEYADFHLVDSLKQIAAEGQFYPNVLSASRSTMNTIAALATGLPYTGRNISKIAIAPHKTSIIPKFKELGFKAQFFYGGFSSWQNIESFMNAQNVDLVYTAPAMKTSESKKGAWGVDDDVLFDFAFNKISNEEKSFNILLTTSYHPPYNVDVEAKGFHFKEIPKELSNIYDGSMSVTQLGHVWYAAKAAADFVRKMQAEKPNSLFVITGDHYSRRFLNGKPSAEESTYVPVIIYGNEISAKLDERVASHFDIFPTLLDLAADSNTIFHSFGESLLSKSLDSIKIGFEDAAINGKLSSREHLLQPRSRLTENENTLFKRYNQQNAISWQYTMKGDSIQH